MIVTLMTTSRFKRYNLTIPYLTALVAAVIIILLPFHAFLSVWLSSIFGHYTALRLWKEVLLVGLVVLAGYVLFRDKRLRQEFFTSRLNQLILGYIVVSFIWGFVSLMQDAVTVKALGY